MVRVANEWLATCAGCEITILDLGEALLDILPKLEFVHSPVLMDHKYFGQKGERTGQALEIPGADVGIITGAVRNKENREVALEMRRKCRVLISMGSCACFGGIPALANQWPLYEIMDHVYRKSPTTDHGEDPKSDELPEMLDRVYSVPEIVKVDIMLPGCPTTPEWFAEALTCLLEGREFRLADRSVCDECPTIREKKTSIPLKRPLDRPEYDADRPLCEMRCLLEQGYLCLGPVTRAGCMGHSGAPKCINARIGCRGCFGPIRSDRDPLVDMVNAMASIGMDPAEIDDRKAMLYRYMGAEGHLRPKGGGRK